MASIDEDILDRQGNIQPFGYPNAKMEYLDATLLSAKRAKIKELETDTTFGLSGPVSSTNEAIPVFDGTSGAALKATSVIISASNNVTGVASINGIAPADLVVGPVTSTDNAIVRYDGTTGKLIQNSSATVSDAGDLAAASISTASGAITNLTVSTLNSLNPSHFVSNPAAVGNEAIAVFNTTSGSLIKDTSVFITGGNSLTGVNTLNGITPSSIVTGPASSSDNAIARYDGTTGKVIQSCLVSVDDAGNFSGVGSINNVPVSSFGDVVGPSSNVGNSNAIVRFDGTSGKLVKRSDFKIDDSANMTGIGALVFGNGGSVLSAVGAGSFTLPAGPISGDFVVTTGNQTVAGTKTFSGTVAISGNIAGVGGNPISSTSGIQLPNSDGGTRASLNHYEVDVHSTNWSGAIPTTAGDILYTRIGNTVLLRMPVFSATATSTTFIASVTALPARIRPLSNTAVVYQARNGSPVVGHLIVGVDGIITMYAGMTGSSNFASGSVVGLYNSFTISYTLN